MLSYFRWPVSWQSQALTPTAKTKHIHLQVPLLCEVQYYFLSFQPTRSLASPLKCLFSNCLLNWGSWFPDGALPSTCTQSLLVRSRSPSCWSDRPPPRPTEGCTEEILRRRVPPPSLQQFWGWRNMWAELEATEREGITLEGYCIQSRWQLQLVTALLHVADRAKPQRSLRWIKGTPQTRTSTSRLKIT